MTTVLVTGRAGGGTSTLAHELGRRGRRPVDLDDRRSRELATAVGAGVEQLRDEERVAALRGEHAGGELVIAGGPSTPGRSHDRVAAVVLLGVRSTGCATRSPPGTPPTSAPPGTSSTASSRTVLDGAAAVRERADTLASPGPDCAPADRDRRPGEPPAAVTGTA